MGFNPLPGSIPGETAPEVQPKGIRYVSIRSRVLSQEKPVGAYAGNVMLVFQSAPGFYPRRNDGGGVARANVICFNPLPGSIPGETGAGSGSETEGEEFQSAPGFYPRRNNPGRRRRVVRERVSIRSRVLSQEKQRAVAALAGGEEFQSAPGFYPRRNRAGRREAQAARRFNPLPGSIPGET